MWNFSSSFLSCSVRKLDTATKFQNPNTSKITTTSKIIMPSTRSPRIPSSPKKHSPIISKTIGGGISKRRKSVLSPKSPSAITPDRRLRLPKSRQSATLLRGIQVFVMQNVLGYCGRAEPEPMEDVIMEDMSVFYDFVEPDAMDTVSISFFPLIKLSLATFTCLFRLLLA